MLGVESILTAIMDAFLLLVYSYFQVLIDLGLLQYCIEDDIKKMKNEHYMVKCCKTEF